MANGRHWMAGTGVGVAAAALLMTGTAPAALGSAFTGTPPRPAPLNAPYMGAFTDSGSQGVQNLADLEDWLGGTPVRVGHTYLPGDSWDAIEGEQDLLQPWADWRRADPSRLFVLNVPMQERNEDHLGDREVRSLIRRGAEGDFDEHFTRLARHLVELGVPDTVIVLGWEMNGTTYSHRCGPDPEDWKAYWNRIVTAMRAVSGQNFRFDFAPSRGTDDVPWTECYPGDDTVDIIGMDSYDQPPGESFDEQVTQPYGLQAQVDFASRHGKEVSYPEWGLFRNGDDPDYVEHMLHWMSEHKVLYQTVTDYCPHGVWQCSENPKSSRVFRAMLSAAGTRPEPLPSATPTATQKPIATPSVTPKPSVRPPAVTPKPTAPPKPSVTPTPAVTPKPTAPPRPTVTPKPTAPPRPSVTPRPVPAVPTPAPTAPGTPATPPGAAPVPKPSRPAEGCRPLELSDEMKKQYESGEVCIHLTKKVPKAKGAPKRTA
ncbi:Glycosyl hydrolase family 26 [Actinacidiphila paucisporea]|uniref:Glycosyl hydrolase family 26 n=1 Tax=Actinacidiphila paucisporea TaxID=310782 RepID=A0A1M6ZLE0_9ACTN|nr:glycosyl hydrolase [Actinacidiphila paucisporea]SHL31214.1 Glycosyl hydrolase family 26 [Actinacidiphila paucisporea]